VAALPTQPVPIMFTGALMKRTMSWMASPDSRCPPGELTRMSMGLSELSASSAMSRRVTSAATESLMAPKISSVRDLNAFSSRYELRGSAVAAGLVSSSDSIENMGSMKRAPVVLDFGPS